MHNQNHYIDSVPTQNWKQNSMIFQWYQVIFPGNKIVLNSVLAACVIYLNCYHLPKLFLYVKRFGHIYMQPPVVKYQVILERNTCAKNEFCKMYTDIEKNGDNWSKIPWKCPFFKIPWFFHAWNFFPGFPGEWEPCIDIVENKLAI